MTEITELYADKDLIGFSLKGHANYSIPGRDIVCAAVSALTINTINAIVELSDSKPDVEEREDYVQYIVPHSTSVVIWTLLNAAKIGYKALSEQYPDNVAVIERR